jgi:polar amino acid transport system substrate-binding protein
MLRTLPRITPNSTWLFVFACIALIFISPGAMAAEESSGLRLASDVWPPFTDEPGRQRFAIDLALEALSRMGVDSSVSILPEFGEVTRGLEEGRFDGSAALWRSPEREVYLLYSRRVLENRLVLVGRSGSDVSATSLSELAGKRVAVVGTYAYGEEVENAAETEFVAGNSDQDNLDLLLQDKVDYILVDELLMHHVLASQKEEAASFLEIGSHAVITRSLHFGVRRDHPGAGSIIEQFNSKILGMLIDGTYNRILQLNWIRTDIDGDGRLELILRGTQAGTAAPGAVYSFLRPGVTGLYVEPPEEDQEQEDRYWIDGTMYKGWESIPAKYKNIDPSAAGQGPSDAGLFRLNF